MGLAEILDSHIPRHWRQRDLSWGWTCVVWLAYILSEGDHRKVAVQEYVSSMAHTLTRLTGQAISELDFTDDRLTILSTHLSQKSYWHEIEKSLNRQTIRVYDLSTDVIRYDSTTVSGYHTVNEGGLVQFGHSKDDPTLPQIKFMVGSLDPLGMPLATDVVSGQKADDKLYIPVIDRINAALDSDGHIYVGDCKMSAFSIRLHIKSLKNNYLSPLPLTGETKEKMPEWIDAGNEKDKAGELTEVTVKNEKDEEIVIAKGYEFDREQSGDVDGETIEWKERVLIVKSVSHAESQAKSLEKRLETATQKLYELTPPPGRGRRQKKTEEELTQSIDAVLNQYRVNGLLDVEYEKEVERKEQYIGRGRGSANRPKKIIENVRYQVTMVNRKEEEIVDKKASLGWRAYATSVDAEELSLSDAVKCYRQEYRIERIFDRLKNRLNIAPMYLKRDDQIIGLTHLLTLGVRVLTLVEYIVRKELRQENITLIGLQPEYPNRKTKNPTAEQILKAFSKINLTIIHTDTDTVFHLDPLSDMQKFILNSLKIDDLIYENLIIKKT